MIHLFNCQLNKYRWENINPEELQDEGLNHVIKHILIGNKENAPHFIMRYFCIKPGGHSRLETHPQEHEIIILHGNGEVQIKDATFQLKPLDVVYVSPNELHQFRNPTFEDFGFICIIPN